MLKKTILSVFIVLLSSQWAMAQAGLGVRAQTLLIDKLSKVALNLPDKDPSKARVVLRLADLHSERGRALAKQDLENNCTDCVAGHSDREQALEYYNLALPSLEGKTKKRVQTQVGHLYELLGQTGKAQKFYKKVVTRSKQVEGSGEAHFSLAEIHFKKNEFAPAKKAYLDALKEKKFPRRGLAHYRVAWCDYNIGNIDAGLDRLEKILTSDRLLTRGGEVLTNKDEDFQGEVSKDYTVFLSHKGQITKDDILKVYNFSPAQSRLENVTFLAKELERLGQVEGAIAAWNEVIPKTSSPMDRVEGLIYLGGVQLKAKKYDATLASFKKAMTNYSAIGGCSTEQCGELKNRMQKIVFDWNRIEKKNPSENLIEAYRAYVVFAPEDTEARKLGIQAAIQKKDFTLAKKWNRKLIGQLKGAKKEEALLRQIEIAELSEDKAFLEEAQKDYVRLTPGGKKSSEVQYNLANIEYEKKNYKKSFAEFDRLVFRPGTSAKISLQSAELALDSLVLLKDDGKIEEYSRKYAKKFPKQAERFNKINRQSVLSQTASIAKGGQSDNKAQLEKAWETLGRFRADRATPAEKVDFYKNRVVLARKLRRYDDLLASVNMMLEQPGLSADDRKFAHENKVFVSEMKLDFKSAFDSYQKINKTKWIELARLSDLAEQNSSPYYVKYLDGSPEADLAQGICLRLVKETGVYGTHLNRCLPYLKRDEGLFSQMFLETYAKDRNLAKGLGFLKKHNLMGTSAGRILSREKTFAANAPFLKKIKGHVLDGNPARVGGSIQKRSKLLTQFEKRLTSILKSEDWAQQVFYLSVFRDEQMRFYKEIVQLPPPDGLTAEENQQYVGLLGQQAQPFRTKSEETGLKVKELWKSPWGLDGLMADYHNSQPEIQTVLSKHIERVQEVAPSDQSGQFYRVARNESSQPMPNLFQLEQARRKVQSNPHDKLALKDLLNLEKVRGHVPTVQYLQSRLKKIDLGFESK